MKINIRCKRCSEEFELDNVNSRYGHAWFSSYNAGRLVVRFETYCPKCYCQHYVRGIVNSIEIEEDNL